MAHAQRSNKAWSATLAWGVRVRTLLVKSIGGNALCTHPLARATVGLNPAGGLGGPTCEEDPRVGSGTRKAGHVPKNEFYEGVPLMAA